MGGFNTSLDQEKPIAMSDFDNSYICPNCDYIGTISIHPIVCSMCKHEDCPIARHIQSGSRKRWIRIEEAGPDWRWDSTLDKMFKHHSADSNSSKIIKKTVKKLFKTFSQHRDIIDGIFPHFMQDYERSTGKKSRQKGNRSGQRSTKFGSVRGALYEGAFLRMMDLMDEFERCPARINPDHYEFNFHPDGWFLLDGERIPIEFKTVKAGNFVATKMSKSVKQSRKHGRRSKRFKYNQSGFSILIVCCPEERVFGAVLLDKAADAIV
ncbi:MAG: hypothetical protein CMA63_00295 [Euryarchaeota archaeon]|nr:hypothetical protein [Euryarchaeota archaeon]